jgi:exodeoxyribonuclease VII large subunit
VDPFSHTRSGTSPGSSPEPHYLSVTDATRLINDILESEFPQLLFRGEISQITVAQSGHIYFTVKDEGAQLSCAMWAGVARTLPVKPKIGMVVRCHGRPNVYAQSGRFQIIVHRLVEDGEGELQRRFQELKRRLEHEGLFSPDRKRPLPFLPQAVGIVTSKTGAVIHDMMVKIRERFPSMVVYLVDTRVQGEGAARDIADAIRRLDRSGFVDVIIVARGGGSLEDLWAFNEEEVVRAVFACSRPIISGVGHEVDVTLCDLAADIRAPTPTAAAEMVVPRVLDLLARVAELERRLVQTDRWLQPRAQRLDELSSRLHARMAAINKEATLRLRAAESALSRIKPDRVLQLLGMRCDVLERALRDAVVRRLSNATDLIERKSEKLERDVRRRIEFARERVNGTAGRLHALSPQAVLERGYSIVTARGTNVRSIEQLSLGAEFDLRLSDGIVSGSVLSIRSRNAKSE